jgi:heptosyltransferase-1
MKILIVKTSSLGDIIQAFPLLSYIKALYPQARVDWVVEEPFADLLNAHPEIEKVHLIRTKLWRKRFLSKTAWREVFAFYRELRQNKYDVVFDLQGNVKSSFVTGAAHAAAKVGFGRGYAAEWPNLLVTHIKYLPPKSRNIRMDYLYLVQQYFGVDLPIDKVDVPVQFSLAAEEVKVVDSFLASPQLQNRSLVLVCPGSAWKNKQMAPEALAALLSRFVAKEPTRLLLLTWGNDLEREYCQFLNHQLPECSIVIDKFSLPALQRLMGHASLVIAMDSLPLHLAGTTSTPTWSLFGPSLATKYLPLGNRHKFFQGACPYGQRFDKRCPILRSCPTGACIRNTDIELLMNSLEQEF